MPRLLEAQGGIPDSLRGSALAVRIHAVVPLLPNPPASTAGADESGKDASTSDKSAAQTDKGTAQTDKNAAQIDKGAAQTDKGAVVDSLTGKPIAWQVQSEKYTLPGRPVPFKFIGSNVVIVVQITPFDQDDGKGLTLVAHGQVWIKGSQGSLTYHTAIDTLSVAYGETVLFYPLGLDASGNAPLRLEISVVRASDETSASDGGAQSDKPQVDRQQSDKSLPEKLQSGEKPIPKP
jgi:hypothetical protein